MVRITKYLFKIEQQGEASLGVVMRTPGDKRLCATNVEPDELSPDEREFTLAKSRVEIAKLSGPKSETVEYVFR